MVQVIGTNQTAKPLTFSQELMKGLSEGIPEAISNYKAGKQRQQENEFLKQVYGIDLTGINNPEARQTIITQQLQGRKAAEQEERSHKNKLALEAEKYKQKYSQQAEMLKKAGLGSLYGLEDEGMPLNAPQETQQPEDLDQALSDYLLGFSEEPEVKRPKVKQPAAQTATRKPSQKLIPQEKINAISLIDPQKAALLQKQNKDILEQQRHEEKIDLKKAETIEKRKQYHHESTKKFDDNLTDLATASEKKNRALQRQMKDINKIGWWDRAVSALAGNTPFGDLLKSQTAQEFDANTLPQLEGQRQLLGGVLSDSDIRLLMQKIVTSSKNPEANKTIARAMMLENDLIIAKKRIGDELKAKNDGYRPENYESEINRIYNERYGRDIQEMYDNVINLPDDREKLNKISRRKVPPGTQLSEESIKMYMELAGNDPIKATKLAREDNYDIPD